MRSDDIREVKVFFWFVPLLFGSLCVTLFPLGRVLLATSLKSGGGPQQIEVARPTTEGNESGNFCAATVLDGSPSLPNAYDSQGEATFSVMSAFGVTHQQSVHYKQRLFTGWPSASHTYSNLQLKVHLSCTFQHGTRTKDKCAVHYSTGGAYTLLTQATAFDLPERTIVATLPASTDLRNLKLKACVGASGNLSDDTTGQATMKLFDIRTEGTY